MSKNVSHQLNCPYCERTILTELEVAASFGVDAEHPSRVQIDVSAFALQQDHECPALAAVLADTNAPAEAPRTPQAAPEPSVADNLATTHGASPRPLGHPDELR